MADLLLELFSEEIPARMQARAADDLQRLVTGGLQEAGLTFGAAQAESGPRRLVLHIEGLPARSADVREERKGPRVGAPEKAVEGFLRAAGLASLDDCETRDDGKGAYYVAVAAKPGQPASDIVARIVPEVIRKFPWPKSMRWGSSRLRWVRPLHSILCLLDGKVVPFEIEGIESGGLTFGHRRMGNGAEGIPVRDFADYGAKLKAANVVLGREERAASIARQAEALAEAEGLALVEDAALVEENAGLAEWPVVLAGRFDADFLDVPPEVLITSMKAHQKCFSLRDAASGKLANRFLMVANMEARDGGKAIAAGNERVIRARLSDAKFFWDNDRKRPLDSLTSTLHFITFHEKLGTQLQRVERLIKLVSTVGEMIGASGEDSRQAARLCKADLLSDTVGEFPELQGVVGRYIAMEQGQPVEVANAIAEHYKPVGQGDGVPTALISNALALADKLDILVGFWAINEKPTGSKDPYGVRRAALGILRITLENSLRLPLVELISFQLTEILNQLLTTMEGKHLQAIRELSKAESDERNLLRSQDPLSAYVLSDFPSVIAREIDSAKSMLEGCKKELDRLQNLLENKQVITSDLLAFFADRLKVYLRERGARHDLIDAVFALGGQDDLLMIVRRVEALGRFLDSDDGANLLAGVKRAANILRIEEKKDKRAYDAAPNTKLLAEPQEKALAEAIGTVAAKARKALAAEDFEGAMSALAGLRAPVDAFFDKVTVNAPDPALRENRLNLLAQIRAATLEVADFSRIEG